MPINGLRCEHPAEEYIRNSRRWQARIGSAWRRRARHVGKAAKHRKVNVPARLSHHPTAIPESRRA